MTKLMIAASAAFCVAVGFSETLVQAPGVVGYQNKTLRENLNYVAPTFIKVNGTKTINLQDIQMSTDVDLEQAEIMVKDASAINTEDYYWYPKMVGGKYDGKAGPDPSHMWVVPEGKNGLWIKWIYDEETGEEVEDYEYTLDKEFVYGEAVVMSSGSDEYTAGFSGCVDEDNCVYQLRENLNYVANPFPQAVNLQDFQMSEDVDLEQAEIMVKDGSAINTEDYYWYPKMVGGKYDGKAGPDPSHMWVVPEGKNGLWVKWIYDEETGEEVEDYEYTLNKEFEAGEAVVMSSGSDEYTVTILCPYDL